MKRLAVVPLLVGSVVLTLSSPTLPEDSDRPLVLWNVTVIDATGAPPTPAMAVVVQDGVIQAIRPTRSFRPPKGAQVVDGGGRFLIPGLWDMHVHMSTRPVSPLAQGAEAYRSNSRYFLSIFAAYGITGVRDMSGDLGLLTAWRDSVNRGWLIGPRMVVTGFKLGGTQPTVPGAPFPILTEEDVRKAVQLLKTGGADFVKVDNLPRELFGALADESRRQGLPFVGHVTETMNVAEASGTGQRSVEHLDYFPLSVSAEEAAIRRRMSRRESWWMRALYRSRLHSMDRYNLETQRQLSESWSPQRAASLYALLARNGTWQVPTLAGLRDVLSVSEESSFREERKGYLPPPRRAPQPTFWARDTALARREFTRDVAIVGDLYRANVPLLAGTDTPGFDRLPAFSLADELALLVRAGLPPMAALQAATRNPARFLGMEDSLGTVEPGKAADLVLLDADPLQDVRNVHRVHAVVLRGRYLSPQVLDSLRISVRTMVAAWHDSVRAAPPRGF